MVWYCNTHEMHNIDDLCPECKFQGAAPHLKRMRADKRFFSAHGSYLCKHPSTSWMLLYYRDGELTDDDETFSFSIDDLEEIYEVGPK